MSKKSVPKTIKACIGFNLVAKNAYKFNKASVMPDKRQYRRKAKHSWAEPLIMQSQDSIIKGFAVAPSTFSHSTKSPSTIIQLG